MKYRCRRPGSDRSNSEPGEAGPVASFANDYRCDPYSQAEKELCPSLPTELGAATQVLAHVCLPPHSCAVFMHR